jgi:hypothetical protein
MIYSKALNVKLWKHGDGNMVTDGTAPSVPETAPDAFFVPVPVFQR